MTLQRSRKRKKASKSLRTNLNVVIRGEPCAYCGAPAANGDHVIPRSLVRSYNLYAPADAPSIPVELLSVVPACFDCNSRKQARRLVPPSWAQHIDQLNDFFGGAPWRVWDGDPKSPAFREAHR